MNAPLRTHADLAGLLALPLSTTVELRKREQWPHVRLGRKVRFTDEQIDQIIATHVTVDKPKSADEAATLHGQTARSARRRAS